MAVVELLSTHTTHVQLETGTQKVRIRETVPGTEANPQYRITFISAYDMLRIANNIIAVILTNVKDGKI